LSRADSLEWFPEEFHWLIGGTSWFDEKSISNIRNAWGMNMSFRRQEFEACRGFDSNFGLRNFSRSSWRDPPSEDVDFSFRLKKKTGKRIVFNPKVCVYHKVSQNKVTSQFIIQRAFSVGYQRHMIRKLYVWNNKNEGVFVSENKLVKRIFAKLLPSIAIGFFKNPSIALRKVFITFLILIFVCIGYLSVA
jgi:glucosyl-dolichyl phosphate glucuronosyltransferase